ncbi:MAG: glycosyltransferase, partial [Prevotellaceae bacterium]|nr:glycosyltransferase [Prevotellaceae bacterium]
VIVGGGEDTEWLKNKAKKLKLTNYSFEGVQNPLAYYKRALIFVMTSACEGLPMTLLEAQQMGAVPVVFDSFTSLHDLIEHNTNGIIIKKKDIKKYSESLVELMQNQEKRERLAKNGLESCKKFSPENIVKQWQKLFDEMTIK